ncbi:MAG: DUF4397 domain-containing protein [Bacteroidota bacterium]
MKKLFTLSLFMLGLSLALMSQALVQIIHNSPTPGTNSGPTVDIYVNGGLLPELTGVAFRQATAYLEVPAATDIEVAVAVSPSSDVGDAFATFPLGQLDDGVSYTVTAAGIAGDMDNPFNLYAGLGLGAASSGDNVAIQAFHGATDAPAVDVDARFVGTLVPGLEFGNYSGYLEVPAASYLLDVRVSGDPAIVATFAADLSALGGGAANVFASGFLGNTPAFGLFAALPDGTVVELPATQIATLQLIHNSPSPTVDVYVNGAIYEDDFEFATATPANSVPAGVDLEIAVAPQTSTSADEAFFTTTINLTNGENYTAVAHGIEGNMDTPFTVALADGARVASTNPDAIQIRAFHGIPGAPNVDITEIVDDVTPVTDLAYGNFTDTYFDGVPDVNFFELTPAGSSDLVGTFFTNLTGGDGLSAVVFAGGLLDADPLFNLYAALPDGTVLALLPVALTQFIHNSPSSAVETIDLYAAVFPQGPDDYSLLEDDFSFRTASVAAYYPTRLPLTIGIAPGDSESGADITTVLPDPVTLEDGKAYTVIANGIPADPDFPFGLAINDDARAESSAADQVGLTVFHGSPGAPNVDVQARSVGATVVSDLAYGSFTDYQEVPNVAEFLELYATGNPDLVATFNGEAVALIGGAATTLFASGILGDEPAFGLFAAFANGLVVELGSVSRLQVIHNSPDPTVDIYVNGANAVPGLAFRDATPMIDLPTRTPLEIAVVPAGGDIGSAVATLENVVLEDGRVYLAMAAGVVNDMDTPFTVVLNDQGRDRARDASEVDIVLFHGSPDAPTVDVVVENGGPTLFDNIDYPTFSDYTSVPPAPYILDVTPADDNTTIVRKYDADITGLDGQAITVFASGFLGEEGPEFEAWVAQTDGNTFPLAEIVATNELIGTLDVYTLFPNPAVDNTTLEFKLLENAEINLRLVNQEGKVLFTKSFGQLSSGTYRESVDLSNWPAGLYQLQLVNPEGQATLPLLITN